MSLDILLDLRTLTSQLPHGNHYSKILIQVIMENIHSPFLYMEQAYVLVSTFIIAYLLQTIIIMNETSIIVTSSNWPYNILLFYCFVSLSLDVLQWHSENETGYFHHQIPLHELVNA